MDKGIFYSFERQMKDFSLSAKSFRTHSAARFTKVLGRRAGPMLRKANYGIFLWQLTADGKLKTTVLKMQLCFVLLFDAISI